MPRERRVRRAITTSRCCSRTPEPALDATVRLAADLARILGTEVDVVDLDRAELELRGHVAETGRLLYSADESRRVRFEVDARMRWIEFRPVVRETTRAYLRRVAAEGLRRTAGAALMVDADRVAATARHARAVPSLLR